MKITRRQLRRIVREAYRDTVENRDISTELGKYSNLIWRELMNGNDEEAESMLEQMLFLFAGDKNLDFEIKRQMGGFSAKQLTGPPGILNILKQEIEKNPSMKGNLKTFAVIGSKFYIGI